MFFFVAVGVALKFDVFVAAGWIVALFFGIDWGNLPMQLFELGGNTFLSVVFLSISLWQSPVLGHFGLVMRLAIVPRTGGQDMTSFGCFVIFLGGRNVAYREITAKGVSFQVLRLNKYD